MDPFTENILQRARERQKKLEEMKGGDVAPLRDSNLIAKSPSQPNLNEAKKGARKEVVSDSVVLTRASKEFDSLKENQSEGGEDADISSPITRTENKFNCEDVKEEEQTLPREEHIPKRGLKKLADLAQNMSNWEDDLTSSKRDHAKLGAIPKKSWKSQAPQPPPTNGTNSKKSPAKSAKKAPAPKPPIAANPNNHKTKTDSDSGTPKEVKWDKAVLDTLESQGFTRTNSNSKLVYNYSSQATRTKPRLETQQEENEQKQDDIKESTAVMKLAQKIEQTPCSPVKPRSTAIANRAALFETTASSPKKDFKDPALMSVSERKALFEKNKGEALMPKAAFGMATPVTTKKPIITEKLSVPKSAVPKSVSADAIGRSSPSKESISESGGIASKMAALLNKKSTISQSQIESGIKEQRAKEMELLLNRFNKHKEVESSSDDEEEEVTETTAMITKKTPQIVAKAEVIQQVEVKTPREKRKSGEVDRKGVSPLVEAVLNDSKRIKVTQPKEGHLYPCLSDIEATTETEPEQEATSNSSLNESSCESDTGNTSFGREILQAVCRNITPQKRPVDSESDVSDVLADMDDLLESDSCNSTPGPTPPKLGKLSGPKPSNSFNYKCFSPTGRPSTGTDFKSPAKVLSPRKSEDFGGVHVVDGENVMPLTHSVSFYRRQTQNQGSKTPVKQISRQPVIEESPEKQPEETAEVQAKIRELTEGVNKQLAIISQTSQALNLCNSTLEFSGSTEQVEAEKLLLLASHRRQAALHEIQRLEVEGTLQPRGNSNQSLLQRQQGSLTITNISLPLKREYVRALAAAGGKGHHVVCLVKCAEQVIATQLVSTVASSNKNPDLELAIPGYVRLEKIFSDSAVTFEVYCLQAQQEFLPHDVKYHINKKSNSKSTPKKNKHDNRMTRPPKESPAGPHAVRSPSFALMGYVVFSIQAMNRTQWTLNKTPSMSPLEGTVEMKVTCELNISVEHRGFLNMFEDVSGFGAWHRRWCLLKGSTISYWKYPDEERKKAPIDSIDLKSCITKQVGPVSKDICARLHTLLLERERWAKPEDKDSLTMTCNGDKTIIKHLLSADTKEERIEWCGMINKALVGIRMCYNDK